MRIPVKAVIWLFNLVIKALEQNVRSCDKESAVVGQEISDLHKKRSRVDAEGNKASRVATKLKAIFE